jgi:hypothetical protein
MTKKTMAKKTTISNDGNSRKPSVGELVEHLIAKCTDALKNKKMKVTIADLIRIRAAREELAPMRPQGEVTWTDRQD